MGVAAFAIAAVALVGCGGGDDGGEDTVATTTTTSAQPATTTTGAEGTTTGGGGGDGQVERSHPIPDVVDAVLASADPAKACGSEYVTAHYLNVAYGGEAGCVKAQAPGSAAESLNMNDVIMVSNSGRARVRVSPEGGLYDGEKLTVTVVREDGGWKVDALESNAPVGP